MLILTGFEPFGKYKENPSLRLIYEIEGNNIRKVEVPVSYRKARIMAEEIINLNPSAVISFGFAPSRAEINVEALAVNVMHSSISDNDGFVAKRMKIYEDGDDCYFSTAPFYDIVDKIKSSGLKVKVSFSAGTYVCNTLFYSLLHNARKKGLNIPIAFIHIPPPKGFAEKMKFKNIMEFEEIKRGAEIAIEVISHLSSP